jgi:hypothetical protein
MNDSCATNSRATVDEVVVLVQQEEIPEPKNAQNDATQKPWREETDQLGGTTISSNDACRAREGMATCLGATRACS